MTTSSITQISRFIFITVTVNPLSLQPSLLFHCSKRLRSMSVRSRRITGCCRAPPASSSLCLRGLSVTSWAASPSSSQRCLATSSLTSSSSSMLSGSLSLRKSIIIVLLSYCYCYARAGTNKLKCQINIPHWVHT